MLEQKDQVAPDLIHREGAQICTGSNCQDCPASSFSPRSRTDRNARGRSRCAPSSAPQQPINHTRGVIRILKPKSRCWIMRLCSPTAQETYKYPASLLGGVTSDWDAAFWPTTELLSRPASSIESNGNALFQTADPRRPVSLLDSQTPGLDQQPLCHSTTLPLYHFTDAHSARGWHS